MASDIGEVPSGGARAGACDAPVAGGGGGPPARAEALDRGRPARRRDEKTLMGTGKSDRPGAGNVEVPGQAATPHRAQQALHEGEQRPDPGAQERHQSAAY